MVINMIKYDDDDDDDDNNNNNIIIINDNFFIKFKIHQPTLIHNNFTIAISSRHTYLQWRIAYGHTHVA